jgi:hypothetical protein
MTDDTRFPPGAWFRLPKALVDDGVLAELGGSGVKVYLVLERHADDDGFSFPSRATIAREAGLSKDTVSRAIGELVKHRLVARTKRTMPTGEPATNLYRNLPLAPQLGSRTRATTPPSRVAAPVPIRSRTSAEGVAAPVPHKESPSKRTPVKEPKPSRRNLRFDEADEATAAWMFQRIQRLNPDHKKPNLDRWANEIRLLREQDGRTDAQIRELFGWANADDFWQSNILSPAKLRKQWDQLTIKRSTDNGRARNKPGPGQRHDPARPCEAI